VLLPPDPLVVVPDDELPPLEQAAAAATAARTNAMLSMRIAPAYTLRVSSSSD
jgi:hypothetical protein